ncbi:DUF5316 domain-containing protein [Priestia sp. SB1]|uniref:DUF5316 domain-containing protein n=1 Tax=Priestia aryabhattai TaxID=412384 RepID=A0AAX6NEL1_PRIAR|nr:DUF5316 domain-containing protein [Priestia aryabhattai]MDU9694217.1 DUF5316 domain-containing protein [Priestia aryabhattai]
MKYVLYGTGLAILGIIATLILWGNFDRAYLMTGSIGLVCIACSALVSGSFANGDKLRANFASDTPETRDFRFKTSINTLLLSLPCFAVAVILYFVTL